MTHIQDIISATQIAATIAIVATLLIVVFLRPKHHK
jgi:hypothetical protein